MIIEKVILINHLNKKQIKSVSPPLFSDIKSKNPRMFKEFTKLISEFYFKMNWSHLYEIDETSPVNIPCKQKQFMIPGSVWVRSLSDW